jgi:uncharacterized membrane protein
VAWLLSTVIGSIFSIIANVVSASASVASSVAVGPRHRVPDTVAAPVLLGVGLLGAILHLVSLVVSLVVSSYFHAGIAKFSLKVVKGQPYAFGDVFSAGNIFLSVLVANLIMGIAISFGCALLFIPGFIILFGLCMTVPLIADRNLGPIDALGESWKLTEGNRMNLFIFWLIAFGLAIAGVCACGIGLLFVMPLLTIALFYIYVRLSGQPVAQVGRAA